MRLVTCRKCGHVWNFKGEAIYYTCCPRCRANVRLLNAVDVVDVPLVSVVEPLELPSNTLSVLKIGAKGNFNKDKKRD